MPKRRVVFSNGECYHIYNRSTGGIHIFEKIRSLTRATSLVDYYRYPQRLRYSKYRILSLPDRKIYENNFRKQSPLIEIYTFCIMPNHFHFLVKQLSDHGINKFVSNFQNGYAKYFNIKND
ncbi:hypothetical protein A2125_00670 [Candidatus Woesebacteria bacterium GWB1_43_5]|uniref:Transposase IS200-like domain-containing protein n=1 Tax=Candidatus Woesebacteria bacterium GWB1_43_5 TaxID=1802474 RepID=A0A1F7WR42_9BACT|nr:MAG: hypothetical protein A2125_00670 [Candidatus Woesebacteria bacterium GWB1_43_5]